MKTILTMYEILEKNCAFDEEDVLFDETKWNLLQEQLIDDFYAFCVTNKPKCRPRYHDVARYVIKHRKEDIIEYTVEALEKSLEKIRMENEPCPKLEELFEKVIDHIRLENLRLESVREDLIEEYQKSEVQIKSFSREKIEFQNEIVRIRKFAEDVQREMKNHRFDLIALATLIFSAFTMVQVNVSTFTSITVDTLGEWVLLMAMVNIIVITTIMAIYSVVRKIHGDIDDETLYKNVFLLILVLILSGLLGYKIL